MSAPIVKRFPTARQKAAQMNEIGLEDEAYTFAMVACFALTIKSLGGRAYIVGGTVRDHFLGIVPKDCDLEVHGLEPLLVQCAAEQFGNILPDCGKSFGVIKLKLDNGAVLDVALPRRDSKAAGDGARDIRAVIDPYMGIVEACRRRDFTINSMAACPLTGELHDPFGGLADIEALTLRVTDPERFTDDALRRPSRSWQPSPGPT